MKKLNKIIPRIIFSLFVLILISAILLSSVFAKYASVSDPNTNTIGGRPAIFNVVMIGESDPIVRVNFAADGEPGNPLGHSIAEKDYDFKIVSSFTEVALAYELSIKLDVNIVERVLKARESRFSDGLSCEYEVYREVTDNNVTTYQKIEGVEIFNSDGSMTWTYNNPYTEPNPSNIVEAKYKLKFIFYNNTNMPTYGNADDYVYVTDGIEIKATAVQIDPNMYTYYVNGDYSSRQLYTPTKGISGMIKTLSANQDDSSHDSKLTFRLPVTRQGNYTVNFNTSLDLVQQGTNATLSVPKTIFEYGEPIPISFSSWGLGGSNGISHIVIAGTINKNGDDANVASGENCINGDERWIKKWYVGDNTSGTLYTDNPTFRYSEYSKPDIATRKYITTDRELEMGNYRIYFVKDDAEFFDFSENNHCFIDDSLFLTEPINICITAPISETSKYNQTDITVTSADGKNSLTLNKNVFSTTELSNEKLQPKITFTTTTPSSVGIAAVFNDGTALHHDKYFGQLTGTHTINYLDFKDGTLDFKEGTDTNFLDSYRNFYDSAGNLYPGHYKVFLSSDPAPKEHPNLDESLCLTVDIFVYNPDKKVASMGLHNFFNADGGYEFRDSGEKKEFISWGENYMLVNNNLFYPDNTIEGITAFNNTYAFSSLPWVATSFVSFIDDPALRDNYGDCYGKHIYLDWKYGPYLPDGTVDETTTKIEDVSYDKDVSNLEESDYVKIATSKGIPFTFSATTPSEADNGKTDPAIKEGLSSSSKAAIKSRFSYKPGNYYLNVVQGETLRAFEYMFDSPGYEEKWYTHHYVPPIGFTVVSNHTLTATKGEYTSPKAVDELYTKNPESTLTFNVTADDVTKGYVEITINLSDFDANSYYSINISNITFQRQETQS